MYQTIIGSDKLRNYNQIVEKLRNNYFKHMKEVYLDHAGATIYSELQISNFMKDLSCHTYGNPHSDNAASQRTFEVVEEVRRKTLEHFNTSSQEYSVIFVQNTSAALNLVANCFKFYESQDCSELSAENTHSLKGKIQLHKSQILSNCQNSTLAYLDDSHTSVIGMRAPINRKGVRVICLSKEDIESELDAQDSKISEEPSESENMKRNLRNLFAYPAQSNFSGERYPLSWINKIKKNKQFLGAQSEWCVLLDAASLLTTSTLDLSVFQPDFIVFSFYKIFGFPTGLGCLLVKHSSQNVLQKSYFGGGTINLLIPNDNVEVFRSNFSERFEDGTLPYLEILAVKHGFDSFRELIGSPINVSCHTFALASHTYGEMKKLRYANRQDVVELYHSNKFESQEMQGPIINFNVLKVDGNHVGFSQVNEMAKIHGICLRSGCFCNIGACQRHLKITSQELIHNYQMGHICGDGMDLIGGRPTGSVRVSYGFSSTFSDVEIFLDFIRTCFLQRGNVTLAEQAFDKSCSCGKSYWLQEIWIYPIKSCSGIKVNKCLIDARGLKNDRKWMLANYMGKAITQKDATSMCNIKCQIGDNVLKVHCKGFDEISINDENLNTETSIGRVHGDKISTEKYKEQVNDWFSNVLNMPNVCLMKQNDSDKRISKKELSSLLSFTNEAQFLLIGSASLEILFKKMMASNSLSFSMEELSIRFRANFLVHTNVPFEEETWSEIKIGKETFKKVGLCNRCKMICFDQKTGIASKEPLLTLMNFPRRKANFGILLAHIKDKSGSKPEVFVDDNLQVLECD